MHITKQQEIVSSFIILMVFSIIVSISYWNPLTPQEKACVRMSKVAQLIGQRRDAGVSMAALLSMTHNVNYILADLYISMIVHAYVNPNITPTELASQELKACNSTIKSSNK